MREKLLLIDGHSILNRSFYGLPDLTNSEGLHTNAVYGFLNIMWKILGEEQADYLIVAFDVKKTTFRHDMFPEYKGTRKGMPEELRQQVPLMKEMLHAMRIKTVEAPGFEADDLLGTLAKKGEAEGMDVTLLSGDRDLLQLASDRIMIRIPKTSKGQTIVEDYHREQVLEKLGVTPEHVIDLKALMGDTADNIPGVPGIGEKTAVRILQDFPDIETAYAHIDEVAPKRAGNLLRENYEMAVLSKKLATIKTDCLVDATFDEAKIGDFYTEEAYELVKRLEFKNMLSRFEGGKIAPPKVVLHKEIITEEKEARKAFATLGKVSDKLYGVCLIGEQAENATKKTSKKKENAQMTMVFDQDQISLVHEGEEEYPFVALSIAVGEKEQEKQYVFLPGENLKTALLVELLANLSGTFVTTGLKEQMHLATQKYEWIEGQSGKRQSLFTADRPVLDVALAAYLCNPLKDTYYYDDIARDYLGITLPGYSELLGKTPVTQAVEENMEVFCQYAAYQAYVNRAAKDVMLQKLEEMGMKSLYEDIELPLVYQLYAMEEEGVQVNKQELEDMAKILSEKASMLEQEIYDSVGEVFNINSPKQLGIILFEKLKLPYAKKTKTGYSTSADILEKLRMEDPVVSKILEYRQVTKLCSTYAVGLAVYIKGDKRIHGKFNQTITATGRISSTDPNLQNIPIRMELGRQLRKVFVPKEGCVFLDADYSQIELRLLAHMSGDKALIEAYRSGQDIHQRTASEVFHIPFDEVSDADRRAAKAVNFGIVYGISSFGLGQDLNISKKEAEEYIQSYFATYPEVKKYLDNLVEEGRKNGQVKTLYGRVRPIPELSSSNFMQRSFGERIAMNSPIQGTAADIMKIAMIRVDKRLKNEKLKSRIVLQVHDELLVEAPREEAERVSLLLKEEMEQAADLSVKLEVEVKQGSNWFEAH